MAAFTSEIVDLKPFWKSSTIWLNVVGVLVIVLQLVTSTKLVVDPDVQMVLLAVLNILNRFRTEEPIKLGF